MFISYLTGFFSGSTSYNTYRTAKYAAMAAERATWTDEMKEDYQRELERLRRIEASKVPMSNGSAALMLITIFIGIFVVGGVIGVVAYNLG